MTQGRAVNFFSDDWHQRIKKAVQNVEQLRSLTPNRNRTPQPWIQYPDADDSSFPEGSTGSGPCCCAETNCLKIDGVPYTVPIKPVWLEFSNVNFRCHCDPAGDAGSVVRLYPTKNPQVWKSKHPLRDPLMCLGGYSEPETCTVTATYSWVAGAAGDCAGSGTQTWNFTDNPSQPGDPTSTFAELVSNDCDPCPDGRVTCSAPVFDYISAYAATHGGNGPRGTTSLPCTAGTCAAGYWDLTGVDDEECQCTPQQPDYDGTVHGEQAETTCVGLKYIDGTDTLYPAYWLLTIEDTPDYDGCNQTRLQFFINTTVVYTYRLDRRCEPDRTFCPRCVNTFKIAQCGPTQCDMEHHTTICLTPKYARGEQSVVLGCCSPATWLMRISGMSDAPGFVGSDTCPGANGTFLMAEADYDAYYLTDDKPAWVFNFLGVTPFDLMENVLGTTQDIADYFVAPRLWYALLTCDGVNDGLTPGHPEYAGQVGMHLQIFMTNAQTTCPEDGLCDPGDGSGPCSTKGVLCGDFTVAPHEIYFGHVLVGLNSFLCSDPVRQSTLSNYNTATCAVTPSDITISIRAL